MVLTADAIQLKYEVFLVLIIAIVAAIPRTATTIGSRRLYPSLRFVWLRNELGSRFKRVALPTMLSRSVFTAVMNAAKSPNSILKFASAFSIPGFERKKWILFLFLTPTHLRFRWNRP
ncbi:hypothetical protein LWI28_004093 [Acer negundo]|uniref:Uncharacterized protein n=1 Tax=Acer negundo TaxID=4023 RepID=A0AAD5IID1_ACENE|nr:hypothetical protein LWI28_004093 [Acer negundo]KAK4841129.1 hypothetical protein QYF36_026518 [Acer negundo]